VLKTKAKGGNKMPNIAINGLGRIGRASLKIILETPGLNLVGVNDLIPADNLAYLLRYDSVYGRYEKKVTLDKEGLVIDGSSIPLFQEKDPANLPWKKLEVDVVLECTGVFTKTQDLKKHASAGAKHVILSAPAKDEETITVVHGVNDPSQPRQIISCASCTTNCIAPVMEVMDRHIGVKKALMTTIHAYTSTQAIVDGPNKKWRRGRAGAVNLVPTSTGAAAATAKTLPALKGKFDGVAVRGPVPVGSLADIVFVAARETTADEVNSIFREEAKTERYNGVLGVAEDAIVSTDIIRDKRASIVDLEMTQVIGGDLVKVMSWYDNEWGYCAQMIREAMRMLGLPRTL
jgi:glyceraldehyde 3-phosphate dehydrogenase